MSGASYREIGAPEIDAAMAVMTRAFDPAYGEAWTRPQCLGILSLPDVWLSLAEDAAGNPIGFALNRMTGDDAELLLLAVDPGARGQGVGAALIARSAALAHRRGAARLLLEVRETNGALQLYRREGFAEIGRRRNYYRGSTGALNDALTLARTLSSEPQSLYPASMTMPDAS